MKPRLDYTAAHTHFMQAVAGELPARGMGKLLTRLRRDGAFARLAARRTYRKFIEAGGDVGDWPAFVAWIKENWSVVLQILMLLLL